MLTQRVLNITQKCPADQPRRLHTAEARRGDGQCSPVRISYLQLGGCNQGQQEESCRRQVRIGRLLQAIDMPRCCIDSLVWEDEAYPLLSQDLLLEQPSFVIDELCSRLIFTTIYEAPLCMGQQAAGEGGAAWN
jgi:hypothetical protein